MQMVSCSIELQKKGVEYNVIFIYKRLSLDSQTKYYSKGKVMVL